IRSATTAATTALHKLVFERDGDRKNRQRLRDFQGFAFRKDTPGYADKVEISCCNILGLDYDGSKEEVIVRILEGLMDINTLVTVHDEEDDEEEDDDQENEDENNQEDGNVSNDTSNRGRRETDTRSNDRARVKFSMTYRDVEGSIKTFDGKDTYPIER
ncbi:hypothetical protein ALC60_02138, partial [Trachymyrmex zeteki]